MDRYVSIKIKVLSFCAALSVVLLHSDGSCGVRGIDISNLVNTWFCATFSSWAVPFFFIISGYFFVKGKYFSSRISFREFLWIKVHTLLFPYFAFELIALIVLTPAHFLDNYLRHVDLFYHTPFDSESLLIVCDRIFGIVYGPHYGVLWYIRALMILFCFAPLLKFAYRKFGCRIFLLIAILVYIIGMKNDISCLFALHKAAFFFLGMFLAGFPHWLARRKVRITFLLIAVAIVSVFSCFHTWLLSDNNIAMVSETVKIVVLSLMPILFIVVFWYAYDLFFCDLRYECLHRFVRRSFWLYCAHQLFVPFVLAPVNHFTTFRGECVLFQTFLAWCISTGVALLLAELIEIKWPRAYAILCGGR